MFYKILAAAAAPIIGDVVKGAVGATTRGVGSYLESSGFYDTGFGEGLTSSLNFLGIDQNTFEKSAESVAGLLTQQEDDSLKMSQLPSAGGIGRVAMGATTSLTAGRPQQIPLGSGNTVPNYVNNSTNVKNMLSRVQTISIPRTNVPARPNIPLGSAAVKSRVKVSKK